MAKLTNTSGVKQAVHTTNGVVFIHPGQTREVELSEVGAKLVEASDAFKSPRKRSQKAKGAEIEPEASDVQGSGEA